MKQSPADLIAAAIRGKQDPQQGTASTQWRTAGGQVVDTRDMLPSHLVNAYLTCKRHGTAKAPHLLAMIHERGLEHLLNVGAFPARHTRNERRNSWVAK